MVPLDNHPFCRLRPFRPEDLPELVRLDRSCFPRAIAYDRLEMIHQLTAPGHFSLLAVPGRGDDTLLLGFVIAATGRAGGAGQIVTLDVHPGHRRHGIGGKLMDAAEQRLARSGNAAVRLQVAVDNAGARTFYRGLGYQSDGRRPGYYPDGTDAVEMVKRLSAPGSRRSAG